MKKNKIIKLYLTVMLICILNVSNVLTDEFTTPNTNDFSIVEVRCLGRNHRDGELTVVYAAVNYPNKENLPVLDLFYTINSREKIPDVLSEKIFNITPMFCLDTEIMQNNNEEGNNTHIYRGEIPSQTNGIIIEYFIVAKDSKSRELFYPPDAPLSLNNYTTYNSKNPFLK